MYAMTHLWFESALLPQGWAERVRVSGRDGRIAAVVAGVEWQPGDERHAIGLPGVPNLHSHAFQRGLAGLTERRGAGPDSFWSWRELMYRFVERITPEQLEALAQLAYAEMLESGFTRVGEFHYLHHDRDGAAFANPAELALRVMAAASHTGIGLTLLPAFYAHSGFGGAAPAPRQRRFINDADGFARIVAACQQAAPGVAGARVGVAPHSLRAVTPEELRMIVPLVPDGPVHIHIAEQTREVEECRGGGGGGPVEWLLENQPLDARWCLVHATHANAAELAGIAAGAAIVGLCPVTEASLVDGIFPADGFLSGRGRIGIGSDSNVLIDPAEELRTLEYSQRLALRRRNVLAATPGASTGRSLYDAVLAGGHRALGSDARAAHGLVADAAFDIVALAAGHPALLERRGDELIDSWVFAAGRSAVDCVWRGGVKVVSGGRHRDRDAIVARYGQALRRLLA